ncbi:MAG: hypothetical protein QM488_18460 [Rhizobiaceae bacterium]
MNKQTKRLVLTGGFFAIVAAWALFVALVTITDKRLPGRDAIGDLPVFEREN